MASPPPPLTRLQPCAGSAPLGAKGKPERRDGSREVNAQSPARARRLSWRAPMHEPPTLTHPDGAEGSTHQASLGPKPAGWGATARVRWHAEVLLAPARRASSRAGRHPRARRAAPARTSTNQPSSSKGLHSAPRARARGAGSSDGVWVWWGRRGAGQAGASLGPRRATAAAAAAGRGKGGVQRLSQRR